LERGAWTGAVEAVERWARRAGAPVLLGAYGTETGGDGGRHNSAFLVVPGEGRADYRYDKRFLVPMIERGNVLGWSGVPAGDLTPGTGSLPLVRAGGSAFGVLICYESAFSGLARAYRLSGA
ncbi:MAG: apolipoprotein N-acyltransferase, partial [Gemmatimonadetes bacterium]|nr:apolipoprotein N-acyltransferase [Gemmatimonadota bacterium]NIR79496.1 apolipoprotein N-acyltransferase [Gemmatimonadota bacterium]NIT88173.1 apolipoprotein N-acyltransferase [Gemmatimonadota bacterium]NIU31980.1 apolipoprotein N-acyltransferase [Gemmatimonadota bacterium]NIU36593.1 apolipoprotein N-acyltransferase [Gemmatimonadota bacterium]